MTRKRFKKILMGRYKLSRNQAEILSQEQNRTIEETEYGVCINGYYHIIEKPLKLYATELKAEEVNKWAFL